MIEIHRNTKVTDTSISGKVIESMFMGTLEYVKVRLMNNSSVTVHRKLLNESPLTIDEDVTLELDPNQVFAYGGKYMK